jgi:competence protein ComEA
MHKQAQNKNTSHSMWPMDCSDLPTLLHPAINPEQAGIPLRLPTINQMKLTEPQVSNISTGQSDPLSAVSRHLPGSLKDISNEETSPLVVPAVSITEQSVAETPATAQPVDVAHSRKKRAQKLVVVLLIIGLVVALGLTWYASTPPSTASTVVQQNVSSTASIMTGSPTSSNQVSGDLVAYILGAIVHPGVYNLPTDARVYQLVQAAGGLLPSANAVALNLAARLNDGEEIYVSSIGETPPAIASDPANMLTSTTVSGSLVNINTTSATTMAQQLHVSSTTAQKIVTYRTQHGPYTAIDQLLNVVSQTIYDHIKSLVTV